jgi:hypothetical protein
MRFQDLFHSPSGVLFAFPSRYWFTIGRSRVFSLGGWSPHLQTGFHVSRPTYRTLSTTIVISSTGLSPAMAGLSIPLDYHHCYHVQAPPISFATTFGISVDFFSSGYLDVSVHPVRLLRPMYSVWDTVSLRWVSPFRYLRIKARLPAPRSFSQATTSFFACDRQGIHHMHLVT